MDDPDSPRHQLRNKGAGQSTTSTNDGRPTEAETLPEVSQHTTTQHYRQVIRPTAKIPPTQIPDLNIYVDSDWAGCPETRRSTTGFVITLLGARINYGS